MRLLTGTIHHDESSAYGLTFPDAPGCFAAGGRHWR
jgi:predicted RNase H-like HicB family nuclease